MKRCRGYLDIRSRSILVPAILLAAGGRLPWSTSSLFAWAAECRDIPTSPIRVEDAAGIQTLISAVNCTNGGKLEAVWAGSVAVEDTVSIGAGTLLSVSGEDATAEAVGAVDTRVFDVVPGGWLEIIGLRLSGGTSSQGGAIRSTLATLTLDNCVLQGNRAPEGDGGAVWVEGGDITVIGGQFLDNMASLRGGAIIAIDADLTVQDGATFESNIASEGGAIYCAGSQPVPAGSTPNNLCSLTGSVFVRNNASSDTFVDVTQLEPPWYGLSGGGAAAFLHAEVEITNCLFSENSAQVAGGALYAGNDTISVLDGCTFRNNTTPGFGGATCLSSVTLTGGTLMEHNVANQDGGAIFGWDPNGTVVLEDMVCQNNTGVEQGGCISAHGIAVIGEDTYMFGNQGDLGGCIYASSTSQLTVEGGEFTSCYSTKNGGFLFASDGSVVDILGGLVTGCLADRRAAAVYCSGNSFDLNGSVVSIAGGTFTDNEALELGGAVVAWGEFTVVTITGGVFANNTARYFGGFLFLEEEASVTCQGATIEDNYAGDQGGGIYAQDATWVNVSCDIVGNISPQGPAAYLTHVTQKAIFEDMRVTSNIAAGGSALFVVESPVVARGVTFDAGASLTADPSNRAIQIDSMSTFDGRSCVFDGWVGDTVVHSTSAENGSLILDGCDFTRSSAGLMVISAFSDAEVRNAVFSDETFENALQPLALVDRARTCSDVDICGADGECLDGPLGVLCECLPDGGCLDNPATLSLALKTPPPEVTYHPDKVIFDVVVSASDEGTTGAIWELEFESDDLSLEAIPSSGLLYPGGNITASISGYPVDNEVGGNLVSSFVLNTIGLGDNVGRVELEVNSTFFLCQAFEVAVPLEGSSGANVKCQQCLSLTGNVEGVNCTHPGATLASLPIRRGYWRESTESQVIHSCAHSVACAGGTTVTTSNDYCASGYEGPYCAVCSDGCGAGVDNSCHSCSGTQAYLLTAAGTIFSLVVVAFLALAVIFLIGGLDAVGAVKRSISATVSGRRSAPSALVWSRPGINVLPGDSIISRSQYSKNSTTAVDPVGGSGDEAFAPAFEPVASRDAVVEGIATGIAHRTNDIGDSHQVPEVGGGNTGGNNAWAVSEIGTGRKLNVALLAMPPVTRGGVPERALGSGDINLNDSGDYGGDQPQKSGCCGLGTKIKLCMSRIPMDKLKILVVVWQILTVFPSIAAVEFPPIYARFLTWIDVVNLDLGNILSASCLLPSVTHYERLLAITLGPFVVLLVLSVTFQMAKRRAGIGSAGVVARRAAWSRHMAAGLLLTFLVFTSASTVIFTTFACDSEAVEGESFLRADYSISCDTDKHTIFKVYAGVMILVYPVGIPLLYFFILWTKRESLNPTLQAQTRRDAEVAAMPHTTAEELPEDDVRATSQPDSIAGMHVRQGSEEAKAIEERIRQRRKNPDLVPSMFLWKDFGPDLYYYEVIECGRRILLTGVLIFIAPHTAAQAAMACVFAFASLLGFELLRPHLDPTDSWLYRLGCVVIFLSNFLALLIKVDEAGPGRRDTLGGLLVAVNLMLVVAVIATSWFATQQSVEDSRDEEGNPFAVAKTMMTAERLAANDAQQHSREVRIYPAGPRSVDRLSTVSGQSGLGSGGVTSAGGSSKVGSRAPFRRSGGDESIESMSAVPPARSVGGSIPVSGGGSRGFSGGFWGKARRQSIETLWREDKERGKS